MKNRSTYHARGRNAPGFLRVKMRSPAKQSIRQINKVNMPVRISHLQS